MQHALIDLFLLVAVIVNGCITGWIFGRLLGYTIGKMLACALGFDIKFIREDGTISSVEHVRWYEAWTALADVEALRRYQRDNQAPGR